MKNMKFIRKFCAFVLPLIFVTAFALSYPVKTSLGAPAYRAAAGESINLLSDGGFENSVEIPNSDPYGLSTGYNFSENWSGDLKQFTPNNTKNHCGDFSVSVSGKDERVITHSAITLEEGKIYRVGAFALMPNAKKGTVIPAFTVALIKSGDSSAVKSATIEFDDLSLNEWHEFGFYVEIEETAEYVVSFTSKATKKGDIGYIDDVYVTDESIVTSDKVNMVKGASIRLDEEHGIRFIARADYEYSQDYEDPVFGIILLPTDYLTDGVTFTVAGLEAKGKTYVKAERDSSYSPEYRFNNYDTVLSDGYYEFTCALVKILDKNVNREFSARAYVRYVDESTGISRYVYSDYSQEKNSRSVYNLADYWLTKPELFTEEQVKILENYVTVGDAQA